MIVTINLPLNEYKLYIEGAQITACIITTVKDEASENFGKKGERDLGYYTKLPWAMERIIKEEIACNQSVVNLRQFLIIYKSLSENITEQFNTVNI